MLRPLTTPAVRALRTLHRDLGSRWLLAFCLLALVAAVAITARLTVFMVDWRQTACSMTPEFEQGYRHSCLTAYLLAADLAGGEADLYDPERYVGAGAATAGLDVGFFERDPYQYPPQFLLLPSLALELSRDFEVLRAAWYFAMTAVILGAMLMVAGWVGGRPGRILALWVPLVWLTPNQLITLQTGNVHLAVMAVAVLAMVAIERRRFALGGALLAAATLAKIFPGVLILMLLIQRRVRPVLWTAGFGVAFTLLSAAATGWRPIESFLTDHLPRLVSGEAFAYFAAQDWHASVNMAARALVYKLEALGVAVDAGRWAGPIGGFYTLLVLAVAVIAARAVPAAATGLDPLPSTRLQPLRVWLLLLGFASLQAPFVPFNYAALGHLWLLATFASEARSRWRFAALALPLWVLFGVPIPHPAINLVAYVINFLFLFAVLLHALRNRTPATAFESRTARDGVPAVGI